MKNMLVIMLIAGLVVGGVATTPVNADTHYFVVETGNWVGQRWNLVGCGGAASDGEPEDPDDIAVICSGNTATLDTEEVILRIDVNTDGTLIIASSGTLILGGNDVTSTIHGTIELTGELRPSPLPTAGDHTFVGGGEIVGQASSAQILLDSATVGAVISSITIRGILEIGNYDGANGTFVTAGGVIHADTNGTLKISTQGLRDDSEASATLYKVSHANAILEFAMDCTGGACPANCLSKAYFEVIEGKLKVDNGVIGLHTNGTITAEPGAIIEVLSAEAVFSRLASCS